MANEHTNLNIAVGGETLRTFLARTEAIEEQAKNFPTAEILKEGFEEAMGWADVNNRGIDYQAGIVFAFTQMANYRNGWDLKGISEKVWKRYQTLKENQKRYVHRVKVTDNTEDRRNHQDAATRYEQGRIQGILKTTDGQLGTRKNLEASSKGTFDLVNRIGWSAWGR
jgi:hypothetical protein